MIKLVYNHARSWVCCPTEGDEAKFDGVKFVVESLEDLEYAAATLLGASSMYELLDAPGGGQCVTFHESVDGCLCILVWGQAQAEGNRADELDFPKLDYNLPQEKRGGPNKSQRFEKRPAPVHKLGRYGMVVMNFEKTCDFHISRLNISQLLHNLAGKNVTAFNRLDRDPEICPVSHVHHSSFKTHDFNIQPLGHDWLRDLLGRLNPSQIDSNQRTHVSEALNANLGVWGPDLPPQFLT
ncbi:hypothetical protein DL95DRAFT_428376 [Leptodontidium sp. 2 PMI_412]|nr:hypothetical protein DL95DRAFT_428376 [Leptodontidium sp. 2 PMI_412]